MCSSGCLLGHCICARHWGVFNGLSFLFVAPTLAWVSVFVMSIARHSALFISVYVDGIEASFCVLVFFLF